MDANSTLISSKFGSLMKSHGYHGCYFAADSNAIDSSLVIIYAPQHPATFIPVNGRGFYEFRVFFVFPQKSLLLTLLTYWGGVLNRGLALQIRVYPKARGAAETIINNQEDDAAAINKFYPTIHRSTRQRSCWAGSNPESVSPSHT